MVKFTCSPLCWRASEYILIVEGEWLAISFCIGLVIALEMVNAAIEQLCNLVHAEYHPIIKK